MANPGPASTVTANAVIDPVNALRLIAYGKGVSVGAAGDVQLNVITPGNFVPATIITTNSAQGSTVNVATATVGVYTAPAQGGSTVHATAALTGQTTGTFAYVRATSVTNAQIAGAVSMYANIGVAVAGGVIDVYVYGYDTQ